MGYRLVETAARGESLHGKEARADADTTSIRHCG